MPALERAQMTDHLEARLPLGVIDGGEVGEHAHRAAGIVAEEERHRAPAIDGDDGGVVAELGVRLQNRGAELRDERIEDDLAHRFTL